MLEYLNPTYVRIFIQPRLSFKWRDFLSNQNRADWYPSQFGLSFNGDMILNEGGYSAAVYGLRNGPKEKESFFDWLGSHREADWQSLLKKLSTTEPGVVGRFCLLSLISQPKSFTSIMYSLVALSDYKNAFLVSHDLLFLPRPAHNLFRPPQNETIK